METQVKFYRSSMERERNRHKGHFFSPGAIKFFSSRILDTCWVVPVSDGERVYFVTSEKPHLGQREYKLRLLTEDGRIHTVAGPYSSARTCKAELADLLGCKVSNL
jgi:hypothetical protein